MIVPTIVNYYRPDKRYLFTYDEKCRIITEFTAGMANVELDTIEKNQNSQWRFINTVEYFRKKYPNDELYIIIGEDSYRDFKTWFRYEDIIMTAKLLVANRGLKLEGDIPHDTIDIGDAYEECSSTNVRNKLIEELIDNYCLDKEWYAKVK